MEIFSHILTTLAMLTHSIVGCCWHHGHESLCEGHSSGYVAVSHADGDGAHAKCAHHDDVDATTDDCVNDAHAQGCDEERCTFIKCRVPQLTLGAQFTATQFRSASDADQTMRVAAIALDNDLCRQPGSAAAACALLQVWRL